MRLTENPSTNSKKSSILAFTETNFSSVPSGLVTPHNTIRVGTQQKTLAMPVSPLNNSTHSTPGRQDWVHVTINRSASEPRPTTSEKTPTPPAATAQEGWNDDTFPPRNVTRTSTPYSWPAETKEQGKARKAAIHTGLSWIACYNNECLLHLSEKQGGG